MKQLILKVWERSADGVKSVTIPKDCEIEAGDYVRVSKVLEE